MENSRFYQLIAQLGDKEKTQFLSFSENDFFNSNAKVKKLCRTIIFHFDAIRTKKWNKQKVFQKAFPKQSYLESRMNNLLSDLLHLLYEFLAITNLKKDKAAQMKLVVKEMKVRELADFLPPVLKKQAFLLEKGELRSGSYFLEKSLLEEEKDYHLIAQQNRTFSIHLQEQNQQLDLFYQTEKLRIATEMLSRSTVVNAPYSFTYLKDLLHFFEKQPDHLAAYPALQVYFFTYKMMSHPEEIQYYQAVKKQLDECLPIFSRDEQQTLYSYMLNYCVRKINSGLKGFYQEILDLYKRLLDTKLILKKGKLTQWTYINIVTAGLRLKNFDWTEQFINDYKSALSAQHQENVYTYSLVSLYFEKGDYSAALQLLQSVEFTDAFYHMSAKIIQLKIYFLEEEVDAFASLILATQRFLSRNRQLSSYQKKSNDNFLKIINRLFKIQQRAPYLHHKRLMDQTQRLKTRIQETHPLGNRHWLENELENI